MFAKFVRRSRDRWPYALMLSIMALWSYPVLADTPALVLKSADECLKATYLGGSAAEGNPYHGFRMTLDDAGNVFVVGMTMSDDFPTTPGAYNDTRSGNYDVLVAKFSPDLSDLLAANGDVYLYGFTASTDLPVHPEAYDSDYSAKFITGTCEGILECPAEADINQSGGLYPSCDDITIGDISTLIDYLFITGSSLGLLDCL